MSLTNSAYNKWFALLTSPTSVEYMMQGFGVSWQYICISANVLTSPRHENALAANAVRYVFKSTIR